MAAPLSMRWIKGTASGCLAASIMGRFRRERLAGAGQQFRVQSALVVRPPQGSNSAATPDKLATAPSPLSSALLFSSGVSKMKGRFDHSRLPVELFALRTGSRNALRASGLRPVPLRPPSVHVYSPSVKALFSPVN
ncbi:hypothetical protein LPB72_17115 [Hydrogenophaga crassostreae]|uniref:Ig-like domain-containing protein n=1 Tax=Hydrogenophaga crassostreae TaxID=1763535 RepID=A0ABX2U3Z5_9BURK|nr:hypothetical protein LPB72_17115 [Hydrogenophaga crassostreae]